MKRIALLTVMLAVVLNACSNSPKKDAKYKMVNLSKDDSTFLALKDTAQLHINEFTDSLKRHGLDEGNYRFIVKSDFVEDGIHEHMWSQVIGLKEGALQGALIDSPFNIKRIKPNDNVAVKLNDVEDWVIYDRPHKREVGNFSAKYLESKQ